MSEVSIELCDLCEVPLEGYHPRSGRKQVKEMQGLLVTIGYSNGGWGFRHDHINFSGEVCKDCYNKVMESGIELIKTINSLKPKKAAKIR